MGQGTRDLVHRWVRRGSRRGLWRCDAREWLAWAWNGMWVAKHVREGVCTALRSARMSERHDGVSDKLEHMAWTKRCPFVHIDLLRLSRVSAYRDLKLMDP